MGPLPKDDLHVVVDALFPTKETLATASSLNICVTWSQNSAHKSAIMSVLSNGLLKKQWRLICIPSGDGLLDQHSFLYNDAKLMMGGSTAFQAPDNAMESQWRAGCTSNIARDLYRP